MIKDKHSVRQPQQPAPVQESLPEEVSENPFVNMYQAVKRAIQTKFRVGIVYGGIMPVAVLATSPFAFDRNALLGSPY